VFVASKESSSLESSREERDKDLLGKRHEPFLLVGYLRRRTDSRTGVVCVSILSAARPLSLVEANLRGLPNDPLLSSEEVGSSKSFGRTCVSSEDWLSDSSPLSEA